MAAVVYVLANYLQPCKNYVCQRFTGSTNYIKCIIYILIYDTIIVGFHGFNRLNKYLTSLCLFPEL